MKRGSFLLGLALFSLVGAAVMAVADDTTPKPAADTGRKARIVAPFNLLTDLSDDQKAKIGDIHKAELDQEKALKAKEHDDIMAVLSDDQKKELADAEAKAIEGKKAAEEEARAKTEEEKAEDLKKQAEGATTQP